MALEKYQEVGAWDRQGNASSQQPVGRVSGRGPRSDRFHLSRHAKMAVGPFSSQWLEAKCQKGLTLVSRPGFLAQGPAYLTTAAPLGTTGHIVVCPLLHTGVT